MAKEQIRILYVGDTERGRAFRASVEAHRWYVYLSDRLLEALGVYVVYVPDIVVVDAAADSNLADEVLLHLQSIDAEPMVVLADEPELERRHDLARPLIRVLPGDHGNGELAATIVELIESKERKAWREHFERTHSSRKHSPQKECLSRG